MALPATASTDPFGTAENYNGFIFENVLHNGGDCEGALAIGGNSMLSNFGAGTSLPSGGNPSGIGMVVKRNSSWTNGQVYHGNMHVGGTVSHTGVSIVNGFLYNPSTPINFSVEEMYLKSLSAYWASLPATSGTTVALQPWGRLDLTGTNSTLNVFFISNTKWKSTGEINLVVPAGSSVIINVEGTSDSIPHNSPGYFGNMNFNGNNGASAWQTTVWNFYNMTSMSMSSFGWKGSILAPYANFTYTNGNLAGNLIAKSLTMTGLAGSAELHLYPFTGNVPIPVKQIPAYIISKSVKDVARQGPSGKATKAGDIISYSIDVSNAGNVNLTNITLNDSLIDLEGPAGDIISPDVLNPDETWNYTGNYTVTQNDINSNGEGNGLIENTVTVDCDQLEPKSYSAEVSLGIPVYTIEKTITDVAGKGPAGTVTAAGDIITYQVKVSNVGNINLTNITVNDSLINLAGPAGDVTSPGVLNPDETWTYTGNYTVTRNDINSNGTTKNGLIRNTVTVDCDELDPQNTAVQAPIERNPSYSIFKSAIGIDEKGDCIINEPRDVIRYRIVVENEGNADLTNITVSDPDVKISGPIGDDIDPDVLNLGEVWVYTGNYSVTRADMENESGNISNTATVSCNELPEKSSTVNIPIDKKVELSIYKSFIGIDETGNYMVDRPGDVIQYQVAVKNKGNIALTGVSVNDPMVTLTGPKGDYTDSGVLNSGELWVFTGYYTVTHEDINTNGNGTGVVSNTAAVSCNELPGESSSIELPIIRIINTGIDSENNNTPNTSYSTSLVADFSINVSSGIAPLTVKFIDKSTGSPNTWSWDFNNDGTTESSEVNPAYTYISPGTYTVKLTISNAKGSISKIAQIRVLQPVPGSEGSGVGSYNSSGGGDSEGKAVVVKNNANVSSTANKDTASSVTPKENNKGQSSTPANVEQAPVQTTTGTPAKEGKQVPGFEIIYGMTALLSIFRYKKK
ncbi:MAG: hypothetical protein QG646_1249 [Euryarchaeota archaeon]|nr:hypothetical protein [Euryarchaeota archaeon]